MGGIIESGPSNKPSTFVYSQTPSETASTSITNAIIGSHEFKIIGYSLNKGLGIGKYLASGSFSVGGYEWAIYFYPDGKNPKDKARFVSVFIVLESEGADVRALFELRILDQSGKERHRGHSHFGRPLPGGPYILNCRGSMWGYKRFFRRAALEASDYLKDDCISISCRVGVVTSNTKGPKSSSIPVHPSDVTQQGNRSDVSSSSMFSDSLPSSGYLHSLVDGEYVVCSFGDIPDVPSSMEDEEGGNGAGGSSSSMLFNDKLPSNGHSYSLVDDEYVVCSLDGFSDIPSSMDDEERMIMEAITESLNGMELRHPREDVQSQIDTTPNIPSSNGMQASISEFNEPTRETEGNTISASSKPSISLSSQSPSETASTSITNTINGFHEFKITGYSLSKGLGIGKYIASDKFRVGGYEWAIYFYPDGKSREDNTCFVSVFVALASEGTDVRALFELTMLDQSGKGRHKILTHFGRVPESGPYTLKCCGSTWGYKRFFGRTTLETSDYLKDDCLFISCRVGVVTSHTEGSTSSTIPMPPSDITQQGNGADGMSSSMLLIDALPSNGHLQSVVDDEYVMCSLDNFSDICSSLEDKERMIMEAMMESLRDMELRHPQEDMQSILDTTPNLSSSNGTGDSVSEFNGPTSEAEGNTISTSSKLESSSTTKESDHAQSSGQQEFDTSPAKEFI
ncbi:uncharacterized protein LOC109840470 isoform X2 [Asparagus officinalis]|uniref:uncharacterized protein LOC109840470 isoform X2 n=1 Tax=Asparagus officinalis TaxID=4686 RepID=UPI00098E702A|nr:uncharacterized protein LOC109840470 isoform X2 [Asparagus officinalis]